MFAAPQLVSSGVWVALSAVFSSSVCNVLALSFLAPFLFHRCCPVLPQIVLYSCEKHLWVFGMGNLALVSAVGKARCASNTQRRGLS